MKNAGVSAPNVFLKLREQVEVSIFKAAVARPSPTMPKFTVLKLT